MLIKWLVPAELGLWQSISVLISYFAFAEVGVQSGLNRELPYLYGKGEKKMALEKTASALYFALFISLLLIIITTIVSTLLYFLNYSLQLVLGLGTVGLVLSLMAYQRYLTVTFRSSESFMNLSIISLLNSFFIVLVFPIVYFFHYYGLLIYQISTVFVQTILLHLFRPIKISPKFNYGNLLELTKVGIPPFLINYLKGIVTTFPKIILLKFGGVILVGYFSPVLAVYSALNLFPSVFANLFYPQMSYKFGESGNGRQLWPAVWKTSLILFLVAIPVILSLYLIVPFFMHYFFPNYSDSIASMQVICLTLLFSGTYVTQNAFFSIKAFKESALFTIFEAIISFIFPFLFLMMKQGAYIFNISLAIVIVHFALFVFNLLLLKFTLFNSKYNTKS